jgi:hypothetical protein
MGTNAWTTGRLNSSWCELRAEQTDQQLKNGITLPSELRHRPGFDRQIVAHREHVDEARPEGRIGHVGFAAPLDLGKNFELAARCGNDADDATCAQPFPPVFQYSLSLRDGPSRRSDTRPSSTLCGRRQRSVSMSA